MKLPKINKADLLSYERHAIIIYGVTAGVMEKVVGKTPLEYTKADWMFVANGLWFAAVMPAVKKWWKRYSKTA